MARADADSARPLLELEVEQRPADVDLHFQLALAYAYLKRCAEAVREANRLHALGQDARTLRWGGWETLRKDIAVRCGEYAAAVDWADTLIRTGSETAALLRVDPGNAPLRGRPDFERLVAGK